MNHIKIGFSWLMVLAATGWPQPLPAADPPGSYVAVPREPKRSYICSLSVVRGIKPGRHLLVRTGPTRNHPIIARLSTGDRVYVCNEGKGWLGIAFSRPPRLCGDLLLRGIDIRAAANCASGWVHRDWVEILTG